MRKTLKNLKIGRTKAQATEIGLYGEDEKKRKEYRGSAVLKRNDRHRSQNAQSHDFQLGRKKPGRGQRKKRLGPMDHLH